MRLLCLSALLAACGSSPQQPLDPHPKGYGERMEASERHTHNADDQRSAAEAAAASDNPDSYQCGDVALSDQATSGGQRIAPSVPCWDIAEEAAAHHRFLARREGQLARDERRSAAELVEAELAACRGLARRELEHSPFDHRKEIAQVIPHREAGVTRGVRIVWKPVPGLTAAWMQQAIACHRARFERMGEPATYFPEDPTLLAGATATVEQRGDHLEVAVETADDTTGQVAVDRANDLVRPRTANAE